MSVKIDVETANWVQELHEKYGKNIRLSLHSWIPNHYEIEKLQEVEEKDVFEISYGLTREYIEQYKEKREDIRSEDRKTVYKNVNKIITYYLRHQWRKENNPKKHN